MTDKQKAIKQDESIIFLLKLDTKLRRIERLLDKHNIDPAFKISPHTVEALREAERGIKAIDKYIYNK